MIVQKTKKGVVKLDDLTPEDWQWFRAATSHMIQLGSLTLGEQLIAFICSEIFLEKNNLPYLHLLPQSIKLKHYQLLAVATLLNAVEHPYYSAFGQQLSDIIFLQKAKNS
jgi:hypothetical protein